MPQFRLISFIMIAAFLLLLLSNGCRLTSKEPPAPVGKEGKPVPVSPEGKYLTESALYWLNKVQEFKQDNKKRSPGGIVLLGDSITERSPFEEMFPDLPIINRGIGGDKIGGWKYYGLLDRMEASVYELRPRKIFLMIGINDIVYAHTPEGDMKRGLKELFTQLREKSGAEGIYVYSILPARGDFAEYNDQIIEFNQFIQKAAAKNGFKYIDLHQHFTDDKGELKEDYASDALHLGKRGYRAWHRFVLPYFYK